MFNVDKPGIKELIMFNVDNARPGPVGDAILNSS